MRGVVAPLVKLAIFALVTVLSVLLLLTTIQNQFFGSTETYKADFTDASGLIPGSDVRIAGVRIGEVSDVQVVDRSVAQVSFSVDDSRKLPVGARFAIKYQNLVGQRYLDIQRGNGVMNQYLQPDATVPVTQTQPPLNLTTVFNGFKPLFQALNPDDVNRLSYEIIQVLQGEGGSINQLLANTASLTSTIADRDAVIGDVINNLNTTLDTVNARDDKLSGLIVSLQQLVTGLAQDRVAIGSSLQPIADLTNVTAGLLQQARPPLADDIVKLGQESDILNRNRGLVENALRNIPQKANNFGRAGSYGSWFNFYLCSAGVTINPAPLPIQPITVSLPPAALGSGVPMRRMKPFRKRNPIVIGAVSIIVLVLLILASLNIRDLPLIGQGATYTARFAEAAGVQPDDDVRVAGIRVGTVTQIDLDGNDVVISFKAPDTWIGDQTRASIEIKTLLGQKYIALQPAGEQPLNPDTPIPRDRTTAPFDVIDAFSQLTTTVEGVNTDQVAESLSTLSQTLDGASGPIRPALDGLSRLSQTISSRNAELSHLLANTTATTQVLAARDGDIQTLIQNGNLLLGELRSRKAAIDDLLNGTIALSNQLRGLVADNRATLGPTLAKLNGVLTTLQENSANLENGIRLFAPFVRVFGNVVGNGRWFDAYICNLDPPVDPRCVPNDSQNQLAFAQSLLSTLSPSPAAVNNAVTTLGQPLLQAGQASGVDMGTLFPGGVPLINPAAIGQAQGAAQAPAAAAPQTQGGGNR